MNSLPVEILAQVFNQLDNGSMWNAMRTCKLWSNIFTNTSRLMSRFELELNGAFFGAQNHITLPPVPVKKIAIGDLEIIDDHSSSSAKAIHMNTLLAVIEKYRESIETISLSNAGMESVETLRKLLTNLKFLKHIQLTEIIFENEPTCENLQLPQLQSISIVTNNANEEDLTALFKLFMRNKSVEKLELSVYEWTSYGFDYDDFDALIKSLPNCKHLVMLGVGNASYLERGTFPVKLEKLEAYLIGFDWEMTHPRLDFLRTQVGSLQELKLGRLPYDYDGGAVLKFIIEEMNLKTFHYGDIALILDGQKQQVDEIWFNEVTVSAGIELLRQFPSIRKLKVWLCATGTNTGEVAQIVNQNSDAFARLQELKVIDHSQHCRNLAKYIDIYKHCRNITRLTIESSDEASKQCLRDFLPILTRLEDIHLKCDDFELHERFAAIRESCLSLRRLHVTAECVDLARTAFGGSDVVIESI